VHPIPITLKVVVFLLSGGENGQRIKRIKWMKEYVRDKLRVEGKVLTPEGNGKM
jgi:hypothetical protein